MPFARRSKQLIKGSSCAGPGRRPSSVSPSPREPLCVSSCCPPSTLRLANRGCVPRGYKLYSEFSCVGQYVLPNPSGQTGHVSPSWRTPVVTSRLSPRGSGRPRAPIVTHGGGVWARFTFRGLLPEAALCLEAGTPRSGSRAAWRGAHFLGASVRPGSGRCSSSQRPLEEGVCFPHQNKGHC